VSRPRLLLVPEFTELEWTIRPLLEKWADVASYDPPGIGDEPPAEGFGRETVVARGLEELDRRKWDRCFVAADGWGVASAAMIAVTHPDAVQGLALGHAKLSYRRDGDRAPIDAGVWGAMTELINKDRREFLQHAIPQVTGGSIDEGLAARMIERFPPERIKRVWHGTTRDDVQIGDLLNQLDCPLLFAKHDGCLGSTDEGFEDAAAAFPRARTLSVREAPLTSDAFAEALREFCEAHRDRGGSRNASESAA
jgi:pimeloyl-ACP methyl ester carboxylesterase